MWVRAPPPARRLGWSRARPVALKALRGPRSRPVVLRHRPQAPRAFLTAAGPRRGTPAGRRSAVQVEAVQVHDLVPGRHEVGHELLLTVAGGVDLGQGP